MSAASSEWSRNSWKSRPVAQDVEYPDQEKLSKVLSKLEALPPLVTPSEENISSKIGLILSFSLILIWGARLPVVRGNSHSSMSSSFFEVIFHFSCTHSLSGMSVRIGRIAGQYAKPRSSSYEKLPDGREVLSFRGDNVNGQVQRVFYSGMNVYLTGFLFFVSISLLFTTSIPVLDPGFLPLQKPKCQLKILLDLDVGLDPNDRTPDPERLLKREFETIVDGLSDALDFSRTIGADAGSHSYERGGGRGTLGEVDFYTSHEGLMLGYESALTRELPVPASVAQPASSAPGSAAGPIKAYYNTGAHFLWIGDRTRQLTGAHVEYFRGIRNPIGIKVGPSMKDDELVRVLDVVNPDKDAGRITLITRYGASKIDDHLPGHIRAVQQSGHPVAWICDPMHGNTQTSSSGLKTRHFNNIISELTSSLRIHTECGSRLGGVSLEFTGELNDEGYSVTECLGGSMELSEEQLGLRYQSFCDPRLNFEQSLDIAFLMSNHFKKERRAREGGVTDALYREFRQPQPSSSTTKP
ncbi:hypothetical protein CVT26_004686 [Gymnopilus dilepis]|uniref:Phospho-2-dehydro-3-deoxyheptonate aldolase n=1 Tax=Gymnopilus dilepis TaxID=231916 RepID=A0A409XZ44_9AGAR|nr:hypothetical protein CVT26_004686 [Gymnopilus dilepis]